MACTVTLIDVAAGTHAAVKLPAGSINLHGIAVSPDGKWAYALHSLGRFTLPTTQLERGWVMTHAMSIIDLAAAEHYVTVLLDFVMEGAADPWEITLSRDGSTAWITLAGVHQLATLDLARLHRMAAGTASPEDLARVPPGSIWHEIAGDHARRAELVNDLVALYGAEIIKRTSVAAKGPRGVALSPDGSTLAVASYFTGDVLLLAAGSLQRKARVALGPQPAPTPERLGEQYFFDAELCFQHWLSCASCHPEGRADGLNWDLLNDEIGNPKNTKSLVLSHRTPPVMSTGVRPSMEAATQKGFMFIQFRIVDEEIMAAVRAYQRSLQPEPSPYLKRTRGRKLDCGVCHHKGVKGTPDAAHMPIDGELTPEAERGLALFKDSKVGCVKCHTGPLFTDLKLYDVGSRNELDRRDTFDNPTCYEMWRTGPFLHDGSAVTLLDMLTTRNRDDKHGVTSHLSKEDLEALAAYLRSL
jgi:cytochrome c peroxidase